MPNQHLPSVGDPDVPEKMKWPEILLVTFIVICCILFCACICSGHVHAFRQRRAKRRDRKKQWPKPSRADLMNHPHNQSEEELVGGYYKR